LKLIREHLLLLIICLGILLAWFLPEPGKFLKHWGMLNPLIIAIFLCQGLAFEGSELHSGPQLVKAIGWGFIISQGHLLYGPHLGLRDRSGRKGRG
jgi:hypothetical protein